MGAVRCSDVLRIVSNGRLLICKAHTADPVQEGDGSSEDVSVGAVLVVSAPFHPNDEVPDDGGVSHTRVIICQDVSWKCSQLAPWRGRLEGLPSFSLPLG